MRCTYAAFLCGFLLIAIATNKSIVKMPNSAEVEGHAWRSRKRKRELLAPEGENPTGKSQQLGHEERQKPVPP
jgi:hypothetical protein